MGRRLGEAAASYFVLCTDGVRYREPWLLCGQGRDAQHLLAFLS